MWNILTQIALRRSLLFTFVCWVRPITDRNGDYITQQPTACYSKENRLNKSAPKVGLALHLFSVSFCSRRRRTRTTTIYCYILSIFTFRNLRLRRLGTDKKPSWERVHMLFPVVSQLEECHTRLRDSSTQHCSVAQPLPDTNLTLK